MLKIQAECNVLWEILCSRSDIDVELNFSEKLCLLDGQIIADISGDCGISFCNDPYQWRTQEFCSGEGKGGRGCSTNSIEDRRQIERGIWER